MDKTVAFCTLGCKVNQYETDAMREQFMASGYEVRDFSENASVYIVNTCTVTNIADRKSRQMLHRAKRKNPDGIIVAVGCYAQEAKEQLKADETVDIVVGNQMKGQIVDIVDACLTNKDREKSSGASSMDDYVFVSDLAAESSYEALTISHLSEHTRAYIKIQDGCNQFCSYCIIPYARGRVRSRQPEDIIAEVRRLVSSGCREIVLTGIHISSYGLDFDRKISDEDYGPFGGSALIELIETLSLVEGVERIRLSSLEPRIITEAFVKRLCEISQICPHFHLSLQSGCDATLKRMHRHYTTDLYMEKCELLRRYFDRPALTTDVIVGFPGETEEEFACTEAFLSKVHFADMHIFKYSKRQGTRAAVMENQVAADVQNLRSERLIGLAAKMYDDYLALCGNQEQLILLEEQVVLNGKDYMTGHSKNYIRCALEADQLTPNMVVRAMPQNKLCENFVFCKRID